MLDRLARLIWFDPMSTGLPMSHKVATSGTIRDKVKTLETQLFTAEHEMVELRDENKRVYAMIAKMQRQINEMAASIQQLQGQVFGDYGSDSNSQT